MSTPPHNHTDPAELPECLRALCEEDKQEVVIDFPAWKWRDPKTLPPEPPNLPFRDVLKLLADPALSKDAYWDARYRYLPYGCWKSEEGTLVLFDRALERST